MENYHDAGRLPTRWAEEEEKLVTNVGDTRRNKNNNNNKHKKQEASDPLNGDASKTTMRSRSVAATMKAIRQTQDSCKADMFSKAVTATLNMLAAFIVDGAVFSEGRAQLKLDEFSDSFVRRFLRITIPHITAWEQRFGVYAFAGAVGIRNEFKRATIIVFHELSTVDPLVGDGRNTVVTWFNALRAEHLRVSQGRGATPCGVCHKTRSMPLCAAHEQVHDKLVSHYTKPVYRYSSSMQMMFEFEKEEAKGGDIDSFLKVAQSRKMLWDRPERAHLKVPPQLVPCAISAPAVKAGEDLSSQELRLMKFQFRVATGKFLREVTADSAAANALLSRQYNFDKISPPKGMSRQRYCAALHKIVGDYGFPGILADLASGRTDDDTRAAVDAAIDLVSRKVRILDYVQQGGGGIGEFFASVVATLKRVIPKRMGQVAIIVLGVLVIAFGVFFLTTSNFATWRKVLLALALIPPLIGTLWNGADLISELVRSFELMEAFKKFSSPQIRSVVPADRDVDILYGDEPKAGFKQQGGTDESPGELFEKLATKLSTLVAGDHAKHRPGTSVFSVLHTSAVLVNDVSTLASVLKPLAETVVGGIYESVTGDAWVPWSERKVHELVIPLIDRGAEYARQWETAARIHNVTSFRKDVEAFLLEVESMEKTLMLGHANIRYIGPITTLKNTTAMLLREVKMANASKGVRVEPVGFMVFGGTGVGKSTCIEYFHQALAPTFHKLRPDIYAKEFDPRIVYPRDGTKEHWEGVGNPAIVTYPDAYGVVSGDVRERTSAEQLQLISTESYQPPMAFEGKGNTFVEPLVVTMTRNGGPRIENVGTVDPVAVPRRYPVMVQKKHGGTALDPASWVFERFDMYGRSLGPITTAEILRELQALMVWNHNKVSAKFVMPAEVAVTDEELLRLGADAAQAHHHRLTKVPPKKFKQQGNTNVRKQELEAVKEHYYEMTDVLSRVETGEHDDADREYIEREASRLTTRQTLSFKDKVALVVLEGKNAVRDFFLTTTDLSARQWDKVNKWVKDSQDQFIASAAVAYIKRVMKRSYEGITAWVQTHPLAMVLAVFSTIATIGGLVAGFFALKGLADEAKADPAAADPPPAAPSGPAAADFAQQYKVKQSRPTQRSRAWREHHPNDTVRGGRILKGTQGREGAERGGDGMHNKAGKLLPVRMRDPIYRQQVKGFELPLLSAIMKNIYHVSYVDRYGFMRTGQITMTHNRFAVTCKHVAFHLVAATRIVLRQCYVDGNGKAVNVVKEVRPPVNVIMQEDKEDAFIEWGKDLDMAVDVRHWFMTDSELETALDVPARDIRVLWRDEKGERFISESDYAECSFMEVGYNIDKDVPNAHVDTNTFYWTYQMATPNGSSGALIVSMEGGRVHRVLGIHTGSNTFLGTGVAVTKELVMDSTVDAPSIEHVPLITMEDANDEHVPISSGTPLGKVKFAQQGSSKNKLQPSLLAIHLRSDPIYPITTQQLPTVMFATSPAAVARKWADRGVIEPIPDLSTDVIDPWEKGSKSPPFKSVDVELLKEVWDDRWIPQFPGGVYHIITPEEAMFGCPALGVESVDMTSSPGYNFEGTQPYDRWILVGSDRFKREQKPFHEWHPDLRNAMMEIYACFKRGNFNTGVVVDSLKAELRSITRVLNVETRIYYAASLAALIVAKQFCEGLTAAEKRTPTISTPMVGINPGSPSWKEIWMELRKFAKYMCLDSVNFDQHSQQSKVVTVAECVLSALHNQGVVFRYTNPQFWRDLGFEPDKALAQHGIYAGFVSTGSSVHIRGKFAYYDPQVMSSGQYRTTAVGSYRLRLTTNAAIVSCLRNKGFEFDTEVRAFMHANVVTKSYGDDMATGLSLKVPITVYEFAQEYTRLFGGRLTTPDKEPIDPSTEFSRLEDIVILKRRFVYRDGLVLAPLEKKSIEQSLLWAEGKAHAMENCGQTIRNALHEAAMHGREYYNTLYGAVQRAALAAKVPFDPPSFDHVMDVVRKA